MKKIIVSIVCIMALIAGSIPALADVASSDETSLHDFFVSVFRQNPELFDLNEDSDVEAEVNSFIEFIKMQSPGATDQEIIRSFMAIYAELFQVDTPDAVENRSTNGTHTAISFPPTVEQIDVKVDVKGIIELIKQQSPHITDPELLVVLMTIVPKSFQVDTRPTNGVHKISFPPSVEQIEEVLNTFTYEDFVKFQKAVIEECPHGPNSAMFKIDNILFDEIFTKLGYNFSFSSIKNVSFSKDWGKLYDPLRQKVNKKKYKENIPALANTIHQVMASFLRDIYREIGYTHEIRYLLCDEAFPNKLGFGIGVGEITCEFMDGRLIYVTCPMSDGTPVKYAYNWDEEMTKYASGDYDKSFLCKSDDWIFHHDNTGSYWIENGDGLKISFNLVNNRTISNLKYKLREVGLLKDIYSDDYSISDDLQTYKSFWGELKLSDSDNSMGYYDPNNWNNTLTRIGKISNAEGKTQDLWRLKFYESEFYPEGILEAIVPEDAKEKLYNQLEVFRYESSLPQKKREAEKKAKRNEEICAGEVVGFTLAAIEEANEEGLITYLDTRQGNVGHYDTWGGHWTYDIILKYKVNKTGAIYEVVFNPMCIATSCKRIK